MKVLQSILKSRFLVARLLEAYLPGDRIINSLFLPAVQPLINFLFLLPDYQPNISPVALLMFASTGERDVFEVGLRHVVRIHAMLAENRDAFLALEREVIAIWGEIVPIDD